VNKQPKRQKGREILKQCNCNSPENCCLYLSMCLLSDSLK